MHPRQRQMGTHFRHYGIASSFRLAEEFPHPAPRLAVEGHAIGLLCGRRTAHAVQTQEVPPIARVQLASLALPLDRIDAVGQQVKIHDTATCQIDGQMR